METSELSKLPIEAQQSIKTQMLINQMKGYGRKTVASSNSSTQQASFMNYKNVRTPDLDKGFVELEKGCELWLEGEKYPLRFCNDSDRINTVMRIKRFVAAGLKSFGGWKTCVAVPFFLLNKNAYIGALWNAMQDVYYAEEKYYCQPVREVYRVMSELNFDNRLRDIGCSILEFDTAYRYIFQDIFLEMDKNKLMHNPAKELERVLDILLERGKSELAIGRLKKQIPYVIFYLRFINRKLLNQLFAFILKADINEIKLSKEDIYWTNAVTVDYYQFRGLPMETRASEYKWARRDK